MLSCFYLIHDEKYQTKYGFDLEYVVRMYTYVYKYYGGHKFAYGPAKTLASALRAPVASALAMVVGSHEFNWEELKPDVVSTAVNAAVQGFGSFYYDFNQWWQQQTTGEVFVNPYSPKQDADSYVYYYLWSIKNGRPVYKTASHSFEVGKGSDYFETTDPAGIAFDKDLQVFS